jgi:hypothetical protein
MSSRRRRLLVRASCRKRGGNLSSEVESPRVGRIVLVRDGNSSCEAKSSCAGRELLVRGGDWSGEAEPCCARLRLVVEATYQSEVRCLASEGLDEDLNLPRPGS